MHGFGRRWVVLALLLTLVPFALPVRAESTHDRMVIKIGAVVALAPRLDQRSKFSVEDRSGR